MTLAIILLTAFINIVLGVMIYNKNPMSATHRLLALLTVIFALWTISNYYSLNSPTAGATLFWIRTVMFITAPLGPVLYLFIKAFPGSQLKINKIFLRILILAVLVVQMLSFTPLLFSSVTITNQITPTPGPAILLFALLFVGFPLLGFFELIRKYKKSSRLEKLQLKYLIVGIAETFALLILTNFIAVVVFKYSQLVIFGPIFSLILVGFISYSIVRHRLLEVRIILVRSVVYLILIVLTAVIYILGVIFFSQYIFRNPIDLQQLPSRVLIALFIAFTFVPLRNVIERAANNIFFTKDYDQHDLVFQLTKIIASNISLKDVTQKTLNKLLSALRVNHGAFIIYKGRKFTVYSESPNKYENKRKIIDALYNLKKTVIFDEEKNQNKRDLMRLLEVSVIVPLFERGEKIGALMLGEKKSGQIYSQRDLGVLDIFAPAVSVAIQNSKSYEEIKKFNITLKKEIQTATRDLQSANLKLKELGRQKDEFMAIASHELKTPVTSIKLYAQLLHRRFAKLKDEKSAESIEKIDGQINKLVNLINDLLDVTKIEEGKLQFNMADFDMNQLIHELVSEMQLMTKHKIIVELNQENIVSADRERIGQVLTNFISNAAKYSPNAKKIIVKASQDTKKVVVSVTDFGMGLTPKEQAIVFERFNRAGQDGPGGMPGLGLGLYISKEIITRHKGEIWVESKKGKGSTFYFSLPVKSRE
jgi:signal transduction histidine kinase